MSPAHMSQYLAIVSAIVSERSGTLNFRIAFKLFVYTVPLGYHQGLYDTSNEYVNDKHLVNFPISPYCMPHLNFVNGVRLLSFLSAVDG